MNSWSNSSPSTLLQSSMKALKVRVQFGQNFQTVKNAFCAKNKLACANTSYVDKITCRDRYHKGTCIDRYTKIHTVPNSYTVTQCLHKKFKVISALIYLLHTLLNYWIFNVFLHSNVKLNFQGFTMNEENEYLKTMEIALATPSYYHLSI